ncbi:MAG: double-strand break repair helicase AddA, partial [Rhodobacteraceae bacterium]|nr:double-strand break repair helicase AddA [Paracoccaceae bacterium]
MLTKSGANPFTAKLGSFPTKGLRENQAAPFMPRLEVLMQRIEAGRAPRLALQAAEKTLALHRFAQAFLPRYRTRKAAQGLLDFDDLIARAAGLLSDKSVAAWVLYRLDGGIDHILVDEAQDTSPGQWQVIEALAEEFTSGQGARGQDRRIFVVGDVKQSIYSFQGADLQTFGRMRDAFETRHRGAGAPFLRQELAHSFRSSDAILRVVDATFHDGVNRGLGGRPNHLAFKAGMPGRVDLWPPIAAAGTPDPEEWDNPVDLLPETHHTVMLADKIAAQIRAMIDQGVQINLNGTPRPVDEGDFLILVRRRSPLFHETIRACKAAGLAIAGADRLLLTAELAVKDLTALLAFLATPEDDLSLAAALRSPLLGWDEGALYRLAQGRADKTYLWQALREQAADHPETLALLNDLRDQADYLRPYELIERILTRHDGRRKLLSRLGPEAEDGIDAFLAQALAYEQVGVPSLTGFLVWMEGGEVEVKRRLDASQRAIRVMTVHGAKGLEAPIVILPDTAKRDKRDRGTFVTPEGLPALWKTAKEESPPIVAAELAARAARDAEESMRLLYVAMTRAECWLIVAAAGEVGKGAESWYGLIADGLAHAGGAGGRLQHGDWPDPLGHAPERLAITQAALPVWATTAAARPEAVPGILSPSALGGAKALPGDAGQDEETAKRRGTHLHLLLEHLPRHRQEDWQLLAENLSPQDADSPETETIFAETLRVLTAPALAPLFTPDTLAEVELTACLPELGGRRMQGTIDRLILTPDRVLAVDFKSNTTLPPSAAEVPEGILRQMGAYAAMLA